MESLQSSEYDLEDWNCLESLTAALATNDVRLRGLAIRVTGLFSGKSIIAYQLLRHVMHTMLQSLMAKLLLKQASAERVPASIVSSGSLLIDSAEIHAILLTITHLVNAQWTLPLLQSLKLKEFIYFAAKCPSLFIIRACAVLVARLSLFEEISVTVLVEHLLFDKYEQAAVEIAKETGVRSLVIDLGLMEVVATGYDRFIFRDFDDI